MQSLLNKCKSFSDPKSQEIINPLTKIIAARGTYIAQLEKENPKSQHIGDEINEQKRALQLEEGIREDIRNKTKDLPTSALYTIYE